MYVRTLESIRRLLKMIILWFLMELEGSTHLLVWRSPLLKCLRKPPIRVAVPVCVCNYLLCVLQPCVYRLSPAALPVTPTPHPPTHCTLTSSTFVYIVHISRHAREERHQERGRGSETARKQHPNEPPYPPTHTNDNPPSFPPVRPLLPPICGCQVLEVPVRHGWIPTN